MQNLSKLTLQTERLTIKAISLKYKGDILREFDENIALYMSPKPSDNVAQFINQAIKDTKKGNKIYLVILTKHTKEFLGICGIHEIKTKTPELGIWIKKSSHGHKYGQEAIIACKKYLDENVDFEYIKYPVDERNTASRKIPELFGAKVEDSYEETSNSGKKLKILEYRIYHGATSRS